MKRILTLIPAAAFCLALCGCGADKQRAALAIEEAKLMLAAARGAGPAAGETEAAREAEAGIRLAEDAYVSGEYGLARSSARKARDLAADLQKSAERQSAENKKQPVKKIAGPGKKGAK